MTEEQQVVLVALYLSRKGVTAVHDLLPVIPAYSPTAIAAYLRGLAGQGHVVMGWTAIHRAYKSANHNERCRGYSITPSGKRIAQQIMGTGYDPRRDPRQVAKPSSDSRVAGESRASEQGSSPAPLRDGDPSSPGRGDSGPA